MAIRKQINVMMDSVIYARLKFAAKREGRSLQEIIREAVAVWLTDMDVPGIDMPKISTGHKLPNSLMNK